MKSSTLPDAQNAFILVQGNDGLPVAGICRKAGISHAIYFNWKNGYEGLLPTNMRQLKRLEDKNTKLKKFGADLSHDKQRLQVKVQTRYRFRHHADICAENSEADRWSKL